MHTKREKKPYRNHPNTIKLQTTDNKHLGRLACLSILTTTWLRDALGTYSLSDQVRGCPEPCPTPSAAPSVLMGHEQSVVQGQSTRVHPCPATCYLGPYPEGLAHGQFLVNVY